LEKNTSPGWPSLKAISIHFSLCPRKVKECKEINSAQKYSNIRKVYSKQEKIRIKAAYLVFLPTADNVFMFWLTNKNIESTLSATSESYNIYIYNIRKKKKSGTKKKLYLLSLLGLVLGFGAAKGVLFGQSRACNGQRRTTVYTIAGQRR
jgi:hypothetical protein